MTSSTTIPLGETLASRYRLDAFLGRGAMGEVFRGHDLQLARDVAVKLLADVEAAEDARLMNEARAAAALNHPGLVAIYDIGRHGRAPFLVMELVPGEDLAARPPRDLDGIARMALQLLDALGHAHAHGIVHRDLKPANVLVSEAGGSASYKITDFGLALTRSSSRITRQGLIVGTAAYLAPEQALGRTIDGRADLYALGVLLYELAAGRLPFDGHDALTVVSQHVHAPVTPPRTFRPDIPAAFEQVILRLLAKDPAQRFSDAAEAARAISGAMAVMSSADALATQAMPAVAGGGGGLLEQLVRGRLVGRASELDQLRSLWDQAQQGRGHLALVSGEPGSGKTRLARELIVQAQVAGAVVLRGGCYEFEATTPYLPFVEALRLWVQAEPEATLRELVGDAGAELVKLAPELAARLGAIPPSPPLPPHEERLRLFDHVARFMRRLADRRGLLLFADDLQWADQGTLALLHYLLRHLGGHRFLALGTYREIELDRKHPLAAALVDWNRERLATRIVLGRLSREDTERLLAVLLGQESVSDEFAQAVFGETEGNPFFVEEVVKSLIDQGQIYRGGGEWQRGAVSDLQIPQSVKSAIGRRLDRLSEPCTDVLRTAATLGKHFEFDELSASAGLAEGPLLDALDEALAAQLIVTESPDFAFSHDKIREVLYEEMNPVRRRRLHQRIGEALEKLHAARLDAHLPDLAHHFAESGDLERGLRYARQAGDASRKVFAFDEALLFYQRARECAEALGRESDIGEIDLVMGESLDAAGRSGEAAARFEIARERVTDRALRASLAARIAKLYVDIGDHRGRAFVEEALRDATPESNPYAFALATGARARYEHLDGRHAAAVELLVAAHALAVRHEERELAEDLCGYLAGANQHLSRWDESDGWARKLVESGRERGAGAMEALGYEFMSENAAGRGWWRKGLELAEQERALATRLRADDRLAWSGLCRSWGLQGLGRLAEAEIAMRDTLELCARIGEQRLASFVLNFLGGLRADLGDDANALEYFDRARAEGERMKLNFVLTDSHRWLAYVAGRRGRWPEVLDHSERARELRRHSDAMLNEIFFSPMVAEALVELGRLDEARAALDHGFAISTPVRADSTLGVLRHAEALWHARRGDAETARRWYDEAIATLDRIEFALASARARLDRARLRRATGDAAGATSDAEAALATFASCGAAPDERKAREFLAGS